MLEKKQSEADSWLDSIPNKLYFSIGETGKICDLKPHVLRYWEQEFPQLEPVKRRGNRRYYKRKDLLLIKHIKNLLYEKGFTIDGAKSQLNSEKKKKKKGQIKGDVVKMILSRLDNLYKQIS